MQTLCYNEEFHKYSLSDGENEYQIPGVSEIVQAVTGKDISSIPKKVLETARNRGNKIHKDVEDGTLETPEAQWIETNIDRKNCRFEVMAWHDIDGIEYAGRTDIVQTPILFDVKSQEKPDILGWTIQLNLYRQFFAGIEKIQVLHTPKTGNNRVIDIAILSLEKMVDIMNAYRSGTVLDASFLADKIEHAAVSLDLIVYEKNVGQLTTNAKKILETVKKQLASYKPENYSEANLADAKRDKAELNNAAKKLNETRIEMEREFMKPLNEFKDTVTETVNEIKKASSQIDLIVKTVEQREKDDKKALIIAFFEAQACEHFNIDQIFKSEWLNKTGKMKDVENEIIARIEKVKTDLVILDRIGEPEAKLHYLSTLDLESAMAAADRIKENRERLEKIEAARTEVKPELAPVMESKPVYMGTQAEPAQECALESVVATVSVMEPEILERTMRVRGSRAQIVALSEFMNANGIAFEKI